MSSAAFMNKSGKNAEDSAGDRGRGRGDDYSKKPPFSKTDESSGGVDDDKGNGGADDRSETVLADDNGAPTTTAPTHHLNHNQPYGPNKTYTLGKGTGSPRHFRRSSLERRTVDFAAQQNIRNNAGAYCVVPGQLTTRREAQDSDDDNETCEENSGLDPETAPGNSDDNRGHPVYTSSNLPANIDIIAEASLVEDASIDDEEKETQAPIMDGNESCETDVEIGARAATSTGNTIEESMSSGEINNNVYEAALVSDGPLAFLGTKTGKLFAGISGIVVLALSIILVFELTSKSSPYQEVSPTTETLGVRAAGNFCSATPFPQIFYESNPSSLCTKDQLRHGGMIQQAVAMAMHGAHPYCNDTRPGNAYSSPDFVWTGSGKDQNWTGSSKDQDAHSLLCQISKKPHMPSLINGGTVYGEIAANAIINNETMHKYLSFTKNTTVAFMQLRVKDLVKVLNNALDFVTQEDPYSIDHSGAYPYAGGLRYDVNLSATSGTKVSNVQIFNPKFNDWTVPIQSTTLWTVTNNWIASGGDGYLNGVTPLYVGITHLDYSNELVKYLENLEDRVWFPPTIEEMSTAAFSE